MNLIDRIFYDIGVIWMFLAFVALVFAVYIHFGEKEE